ncbi:MAG: hypothetical protein ACI38U_09660 [Corynebacterium sp.]|uniref:hypothetical protein n=1 Tax=Corynebacterium sp. TaxID=1720 RepID=UPI003F058153
MDSLITLRVSHSHLFPGAVLRLRDGQQLPADPAECLLIFSDESDAEAEFVPGDGGDPSHGRLLVSDYTTGAGTAISAKNWHLTATASSGLKVTRRADDA